MKIDIKMIVIICLSLIVIGFIMFGGKKLDTSSYDKERKVLQEQIDSLEVLKSGVDARIGGLENSYNKILKEYDIKVRQNDSLSKQIEYQNSIIANKTVEYNKSQEKLNKLNKDLDNFRKNPPNREGIELIDNLQNIFN